ncbi:hypothetical protein D3C75_664070 [compost metagenome]
MLHEIAKILAVIVRLAEVEAIAVDIAEKVAVVGHSYVGSRKQSNKCNQQYSEGCCKSGRNPQSGGHHLLPQRCFYNVVVDHTGHLRYCGLV